MAELRRAWPTRIGKNTTAVSVWLLLNVVDILTTHVGLRLGNVEGNPLTARLMATWGQPAAYSLKLLVALLVVVLLLKLRRPQLLTWATYAVAALTVSNIGVLLYSLHYS